MTTIDIKDAKGAKAGTAELAASVFGIEPNLAVMHQVVRAQRASWRQGTHDTRTRGEVRGGGKKPWKQKGTGRARQGRHPLSSVARRRYRLGSASSLLRLQGEQQGSQACYALGPFRQACRRRADRCRHLRLRAAFHQGRNRRPEGSRHRGSHHHRGWRRGRGNLPVLPQRAGCHHHPGYRDRTPTSFSTTRTS